LYTNLNAGQGFAIGLIPGEQIALNVDLYHLVQCIIGQDRGLLVGRVLKNGNS